MITLRPSAERGLSRTSWLDSRHTFSFDQYYDPAHTQFRALRVINEDWVSPGAGFPMHPHREMEIITWVLEGALEHKDSLGNGSVIRPGDVQRMSAGTGIVHGEFNPSKTEAVHLLQIWILPGERRLPPSYEQKSVALGAGLRRIASPHPANGEVTVHQDVSLYAGRLAAGEQAEHQLAPGRHAWLQLTSGDLEVNGTKLAPGDGAAVSDESLLRLTASSPSAFLLFDLA